VLPVVSRADAKQQHEGVHHDDYLAIYNNKNNGINFLISQRTHKQMKTEDLVSRRCI